MKKQLLFVLLCIFFAGKGVAQEINYPKGAYLSFEEVLAKSPGANVDLETHKRTTGDIKMNGGNDFKLVSADQSVEKKAIKREYFAYSNGDSLFINGIKYNIQPWYSPVLSDGKFFVIKGGISMVPKIQKEQLKNKQLIGNMFGGIGGAIQGAKLATIRLLYLIDKQTNEITTVTPDYLKELLAPRPEFLEAYENLPEQNDPEAMLTYLKLINTDEQEK